MFLIGLLLMNSKLEEWKALAVLENKKARKSWGYFLEKKTFPKSGQPISNNLSKEAKKINKMLGRGYTREHIAKRLQTTTNRVGQIITSYGLPKK